MTKRQTDTERETRAEQTRGTSTKRTQERTEQTIEEQPTLHTHHGRLGQLWSTTTWQQIQCGLGIEHVHIYTDRLTDELPD